MTNLFDVKSAFQTWYDHTESKSGGFFRPRTTGSTVPRRLIQVRKRHLPGSYRQSLKMRRTMAKTAANVRSTAASGSVVYESDRAGHEYLQFHYAKPDEIAPYECAPQDALEFLPRSVQHATNLVPEQQRKRALDLGCAVGRASFELSEHFDEVIGIDFSQKFVDLANEMKTKGSMEYTTLVQGEVMETRIANVPTNARPTNVSFQQGDACNLPSSLGQFDVVFASNLLCRLPEPAQFLDTIAHFLQPGGILALISPYSWLEEYTPKDKWIGGVEDANGQVVDSFSVVQQHLSSFQLEARQDYPFMIREHARKFQWGVSDGTFWRKE